MSFFLLYELTKSSCFSFMNSYEFLFDFSRFCIAIFILRDYLFDFMELHNFDVGYLSTTNKS